MEKTLSKLESSFPSLIFGMRGWYRVGYPHAALQLDSKALLGLKEHFVSLLSLGPPVNSGSTARLLHLRGEA